MTDHADPRAYLAELLAQEHELDFPSFDLDRAFRVGSWLRAAAVERGHAVGISIALGDQVAFHAGTVGAAALNDAWILRKFRVVRHYGHSSLAVRYTYLADGDTFEASSALDPLQFAAAGGGFPLRVGGTLVGAVGVSGLEMHADHDLVVEALRAELA